jgi:diguanylate cyclase (GGDEF)-like protein
MLTIDQELILACQSRLECLLRGETPEPLDIPAEAQETSRRLADTCNRLINAQLDASTFLVALANGNLDVEPPLRNQFVSPFKQLHASLRHLVWQTNQIAAGDLDQQVDFLGELSSAFNSMIEALRQKQSIEEMLRYLSNHDPMTGLYNRLYFNEELSRLDHGRQFPVSIIMVDINGLKKMNDTHGHEAGDQLIVAAAEVLRTGIRNDDIAARLGGDEFSVILPLTRSSETIDILHRIREQEILCRTGKNVPLFLSYGYATAELPGEIQTVLKSADKMMYEEKSAFYENAPTVSAASRGTQCRT